MLYNDILEANGNTPLIKLNKMVPQGYSNVYVKFEGLNIGGSIKTRSALNMIKDAEKKGLLNSDSHIVEATSGNQGIGLALVGAVKGYKVKIIMPDSVSLERRKLIMQYGAEIELVHDDNNIGECIKKCEAIALEYREKDKKVFVPSQFKNLANVQAQRIVGREILEDLKFVDGFCSGIGTGGTITGVGTELKKANINTYIIAIEPENAAILSHREVTSHIQMGIGDGLIPDILDQRIYDEIMVVSDEDAIKTSKALAREEGIIAGISSGSNVYVALELAKRLGEGKTVVTVLPDTGERYCSTELFE